MDPMSAQERAEADHHQEEHDVEAWIDAGAPDPLAMWRMIQDLLPVAEAPGETPPALSDQTMALLPLETVRHYLGGISQEAFDRNVRASVKVKAIGSRKLVTTESLREYVASGSYKSLAA